MVVGASGGTPVCCGKPMVLMQEKTADQDHEKHVPGNQEDRQRDQRQGRLRSVDNISIKWLPPSEKPEAEFPISDTGVKARELCNVHGLWTNKA